MAGVNTLVPDVGMVRACSALRVHRSGVYREDVRRRCLVTPTVIRKPRPAPPLALSAPERQVLHDVLCCERFVDCAPPTVYATLLDEGTYLASVRTMYRLLAGNDQARERRNQRTHPVYTKPELLATVLRPDLISTRDPTLCGVEYGVLSRSNCDGAHVCQ